MVQSITQHQQEGSLSECSVSTYYDDSVPDDGFNENTPTGAKMTKDGKDLRQSLESKWLDKDICDEPSCNNPDAKLPFSKPDVTLEKDPKGIVIRTDSVSSNESESSTGDLHNRRRRGATERLDSILHRITRISIPPRLAIFLGSCMIAVPMIGFSIIILALVFTKRMEKATCPYPELCPSLNETRNDFYYVDFPATRLVFVASWSSSISLVLVNMLMMMFSYYVAREITVARQFSKLPTPYQATILLKTLNGELWALLDFLLYKCKNVSYRKRGRPQPKLVIPPVLFQALGVFSVGVFMSILIQSADTWLHISTDTVLLVQVQSESISDHQYSRSLQPVGFNDSRTIFDDSKWPMCDKYLWGYSIDCSASNWVFRNRSLVFEIRTGTSSFSKILNYTDDEGTTYAILGPSGISDSIDWTASSFGVSTSQCRPLPQASCNSTYVNSESKEVFNCTKDAAGLDFSGSFDTEILHMHYLDFHSAIKDVEPFSTLYSGEKNIWFSYKQNPVPIPSHKDTVFLNPWRWVVAYSLLHENPFRDSQSPYIWKMNSNDQTQGSYVMASCETTIWNITYDFVDGQVRNISKTKSNSITTGTANMPSLGLFDHSYTYLNSYFDINAVETSVEDMVNATAFSFSKDFASVLGAQTVQTPAEKAQSRNALLVSQVPKSALWTLILANLIYALLGISLAILAFFAFSNDVHQLNVRFSVAGLVAGLFERPFSHRPVNGETDLFEEDAREDLLPKRIATRRTNEGGAELVVVGHEDVGD